jgi:hypothetical protein
MKTRRPERSRGIRLRYLNGGTSDWKARPRPLRGLRYGSASLEMTVILSKFLISVFADDWAD